jgi:hypothetical protein
MITPAEIRKKAWKLWENQSFLRSQLKGENMFPWSIPCPRLQSGRVLEDFSAIRQWIQALREGSKEKGGFGYRIQFSQVNHRQLGEQELPCAIIFESREDFLQLIGKDREYERFQDIVRLVFTWHPDLQPLIERSPGKVLEYGPKWPQLLRVCDFFLKNPRPNRYLRELDIPDVDSKFIEQHRSILSELLDHILPPDCISAEITGLSGHGFERRFGLKYDEPLIRFRLLDQSLMRYPGMADMSIPLSNFTLLSVPCDRVFVTENKVNGLIFPQAQDSMVIFGLGYGIQSLQHMEWLKDRRIHYWGDIDTHGFAMLSQLRHYFPQTRSFLMDRQTLDEFQMLWVTEPSDKRCIADLPNLNPEETRLYVELRDNSLGENIRLEQERISFQYLCKRLPTTH